MDNPDHIIRDVASLRALYGEPVGAAVSKQVDHLHPHYQALIRASPFCVLASVGETVEITPRGDAPGFVEIADAHTLLLPDRRGNNRIERLLRQSRLPLVALLRRRVVLSSKMTDEMIWGGAEFGRNGGLGAWRACPCGAATDDDELVAALATKEALWPLSTYPLMVAA